MAPTRCIPLREKQVPTDELSPLDRSQLSKLTVELGRVNTSPLLTKILRHDPPIWTEAGQASNLRFHRAFHDKIGVDQVVFTFCDDLLKQVYRLPWWRNWEEDLGRIFAQIGINPSRVIRCLLARLPPGVEIPVHHDTGLWSMRSHRVHVPLVTSGQDGADEDEVVFRCGASEGEMERFRFVEDVAVELNNRGKHAVKNNWNEHRIHLILDYVEQDMDSVTTFLEADDVVEQTRRTIVVHPRTAAPSPPVLKYSGRKQLVGLAVNSPERSEQTKSLLALINANGVLERVGFLTKSKRYSTGECTARTYALYLINALGEPDARKALDLLLPLITDPERKDTLERTFDDIYDTIVKAPRAPRYVIIGAMKCGTTSLYEYISQHPEVLRANGKEPHYFDWKWDKACKIQLTQEMRDTAKKLIRWTQTPSEAQTRYLLPFRTRELMRNPELVSGEATPSYLLGGYKVARRMLEATCGDLRIIVTLRDPTLRAFSHYQMTADRKGTETQLRRRGCVGGKTFQDVVQEDLQLLAQHEVHAAMDPAVFEDKYLSGLPQSHGSHSYVGRGLYALQLKQWFKVFPRKCFHFVFLESLKDPQTASAEMKKIFSFIGVAPDYTVADFSKKNARTYTAMPTETERELRGFYRPYIEDLEQLLSVDLGHWKGETLSIPRT